ncbi:MAG: DNA repair protein RecN [Oscillospiraceae bacterium]|jgi:DNA repair protein RecN (Recombination protein N)
MLQDLHIENIAVIERADVSFTPGLNVLTGETGAGKSIIIDALYAVMGARASRELVRTGAEKAVATATFESGRGEKWLAENEIDCDGELILQRRVTEEGKSSCRVCGEPVTAAQLRDLSGLLLDIHGQNDGRQLMDESRHREYLDAFGTDPAALADFREAYAKYAAIRKEQKRLSMDEAEKERLADDLRATIAELEAADLKPGEEDQLSVRRELLRNAEKLTESLRAAYDALYDGEESAVSLAESAAAQAERAARYAEELSPVPQTIRDAAFSLRDASETIHDFLDGLDFSPEEYDRLESRLATLRRLEKRYGCTTDTELLEKLDKASERLGELEYAGDRLEKLEKELAAQIKETQSAAAKLSAQRRKAADELQTRIENELKALSMPSVRFVVDITPIAGDTGFDQTGADEVCFRMSANKGEKSGPISKIASGGELARIMLAMKNVFSEKDGIETLVFDEIDTGVSGVAAQRVGEKLAELSRTKQVLCVTHLPQIAAMADTHFLIEKAERDGRTYTSVRRLDHEGRARELARLHGGDHITENTLLSAEEQLDAAEDFKKKLK